MDRKIDFSVPFHSKTAGHEIPRGTIFKSLELNFVYKTRQKSFDDE